MADGEDAKRQWVARVLGLELSGPTPERKPVAGAGDAAKRCLHLWLDAKEAADAGLGRLQKELQGTNDPMFLRIADRGLSAISGRLQVGLRVGLAEFARDPDPAGPAAAKLAQSVTDFLGFVETDRAVALCDENPFGADVGLRATLGGALKQIDRELSALRA
jgi:hypothetical protein